MNLIDISMTTATKSPANLWDFRRELLQNKVLQPCQDQPTKFVQNFISTWHFFFPPYHKIPCRCLLVHHILRRKTWKSPFLDTEFWKVTKIKQDSRKCLLSSLTCSQIWLLWIVGTVVAGQGMAVVYCLRYVTSSDRHSLKKKCLKWMLWAASSRDKCKLY